MNKFLSLIMSCFLLFGSMPFNGFAKGLEQSNVIDSIKLVKTDLQVGESVKLNVTFSEKNEGQIKGGDTITIKLPQMSDEFGKAGLFGSESDSGTEIKNSDGVVLGILTVTEGDITITFTEEAEHLDNVRGKFSLYAAVKNSLGENQNKENSWTTETDFGLDVNKEHISINRPGRDEGQTGGNPFFYKTGESQSDHKKPNWWLVANPDRHEFYPYAQPTRINDYIKPGHILIEDSVRFSIGGKVNGTLTPKEFMAKGYGKYHLEDNSQFSVEITAAILNGSSVAVQYQTKIIDPTLENYENTASATYPSYYPGVNDTIYKPHEVSHTVANYMSSAEIEGDMKNSISLVKVDSEDDSKLLVNAVFDLLQNGETIKAGLTTDANGKIIIKHLKPGKYQVKETKAPEGYQLSKNNIYDVTITSASNKPTITIKNSKLKPLMPTEETIESEGSIEEIESLPAETATSESIIVTEETVVAIEETLPLEEEVEELETIESEVIEPETVPEVTETATSESVVEKEEKDRVKEPESTTPKTETESTETVTEVPETVTSEIFDEKEVIKESEESNGKVKKHQTLPPKMTKEKGSSLKKYKKDMEKKDVRPVLPQTGENSNKWLKYLGFGIFLGGMIVSYSRRKSSLRNPNIKE